jgi:dUTP pyrophosphatase
MQKMQQIRFKRLVPQAVVPVQAHPGDAGMDIQACEGVTLVPGARALVKTGLSVEIPLGMEAQVRPRSGLAFKHGVTVLNAPGTIDAGYRGEIGILLINHGSESFVVEPGMRIAQIVFAAVAQVTVCVAETLGDTARGTGGFGSTGVN